MRQQNRAMRRKMVINIQVEFTSVEHNLLQALFHHEHIVFFASIVEPNIFTSIWKRKLKRRRLLFFVKRQHSSYFDQAKK